MQRYLGIDVHKASSTCVVVSARGKRVRSDRVETNGEALVRYVESLAGEVSICLEEGEWSEWLVEILSPYAREVLVWRAEKRRGVKNDQVDAGVLAERLRTGQLGVPVYKAPCKWAKLRESVRVYEKLTQDVVRAKLRLGGLLRRRAVSYVSAELYNPEWRGVWIGKLPVALQSLAELLGFELDAIDELRVKAERAMLEEAKRFPVSKILKTAPGIGPIRSAQLLATVVTPYRFRTKRQFWSYCGLGVVTRTSSDWVQAESGWQRAPVIQTRGLNRNCNRRLKALFKGAATNALRHRSPSPMRAKYEQLLAAGTRPNLAKLTIARKIAATVLAMWKTKTRYQPMR